MKKLYYLLILLTVLLASCGMTQTVVTPESHTIPLSLSKMPASNIYINMDYGIRLNVTDKRASTAVLNKYDVNLFNTPRPQVSTYPDITSFVSESMRQYMQTMGFDLDSDISTDYMLQLEITQFQISLPADDLLRVVSIDISVPVVEQEGNTLFVLTYRCAASLGIAVQGKEVCLASVAVRMKCHKQGVVRTDRNTARVKFRISLARSVEPVAPGIRSLIQCRGKQVYLSLLCIFLYG